MTNVVTFYKNDENKSMNIVKNCIFSSILYSIGILRSKGRAIPIKIFGA